MRVRLPGRLSGVAAALTAFAALAAGTAFVLAGPHAPAVGAALAPAAAAPSPPPVAMTPAANISMTWSRGDDHIADARRLRDVVNDDVTVPVIAVLNDPNNRQTTRRCTSATTAPNGVLRNVQLLSDWYCLPEPDTSTTAWTPQGISGIEDAFQGLGGRRVMAFSWHENGVGQSGPGSRLSFLDMGNGRYGNVLLVEPTGGADRPSYRNLRTHAGGLAWATLNYLFVAEVHRGVYVFDLRNLLKLSDNPRGNTTDTSPGAVGLRGNTYYARGFDYALPMIGLWRSNAPGVTFDYMSVDRSAAETVLTGEWCRPPMPPNVPAPGACSRTGRLYRWDIDDLTDFDRGRITSTQAFHGPTPFTQGAVSWKGCYYFNDGNGGVNSFLVIDRPNTPPPAWWQGARGLQDLYLTRSTNLLWTLTEYPYPPPPQQPRNTGPRVLYGVSRPNC